MYIMFVKNGFSISELNRTDIAMLLKIKSITLEIPGELAFGLLKGENEHRFEEMGPLTHEKADDFASVLFIHG